MQIFENNMLVVNVNAVQAEITDKGLETLFFIEF